MMSLRAGLAVASLVLLGAALGVAGDRWWLAHHRSVTVAVDAGHAARFHAMLDALGLNDSQRVAIEGILGHFQDNVDQTWTALQPRLQGTMDSARYALEAVLDEGQRAMFREWLAAEQQRLHRGPHIGFPH